MVNKNIMVKYIPGMDKDEIYRQKSMLQEYRYININKKTKLKASIKESVIWILIAIIMLMLLFSLTYDHNTTSAMWNAVSISLTIIGVILNILALIFHAIVIVYHSVDIANINKTLDKIDEFWYSYEREVE